MKAGLDGVAAVSGVRAGGHVPRFIAEDAMSLARFVADPARRRSEERAAGQARTAAEAFALSRAYFGQGPVQNPSEIAGLLRMAADIGASRVCEIGAQDAGSSVMFSRVLRPDLLVVMDLYMKNRWRLRRAAPEGQVVKIIDGDTSHAFTVARLRRKLRGRQLDLLLIDGDHRWDGVRHDFLTYRRFVRGGGLIAFHDICDVYDTETGGWAGNVPEFWRLVRSLYPATELIDTPGQQGLGIGVISYDPSVSVARVAAASSPPTR